MALAAALGYSIAEQEWHQDPGRWGLGRFPRRFLRILGSGLRDGRISPASAASLTDSTIDEMVELMAPPAGDGDASVARELDEYRHVRAHAAG